MSILIFDAIIPAGFLALLLVLVNLACHLGDVTRWLAHRIRHWVRLPLPLLKAVTWRKRRRNTHCTFLSDALDCPFTEEQERALEWLEKEFQ